MMIKRGGAIFKIFLLTSAVSVILFIALATMTNMLEIAKVEWCLAALLVFCTVFPFLIEALIYGIGLASKRIRKVSKKTILSFEPADAEHYKAYIETIADGKTQCLFFVPDGRIVLTPSEDTKFYPSGDVGENKIAIYKTGYSASRFYRSLYDMEPVVRYEVYGSRWLVAMGKSNGPQKDYVIAESNGPQNSYAYGTSSEKEPLSSANDSFTENLEDLNL